ncbi:Cysteine desulfurase, mitochondrial, partial [Mucuna pruriens]
MTSKLVASNLRHHLTRSSHVLRWKLLSTAAAAAVAEHDGKNSSETTMKGVKISGRPLYLDVQATSPVDPRVLDAMLPFYLSRFGNPHSRTHFYGWESDEAVERARAQVASLIGASPKEIVFTSGATESNNISVKGVMHFYKEKKRHVITTQTEHKCVLDSCRHLQQEGFDVTYLPVESDGLVDLEKLRAAIRPDTGLVSVMAVNNEIGVVQPVEEIGRICKEFNVPFHTDAAQALGKIPIDVEKWNVSLMSLSGHKVYGPKGVGALYLRRRPRIRVEPQMNGGGQERGIRSGTVATPLVVGMGAACEVAMNELEYDEKRISALQQRLLNGIREKLDGVVVNGSLERRYAGNLNLSFAYVEGESLLMGLKEVAVSSGSACTSASLEPSYVLRALGVEEDMAHTSIRFGIGRFTTEAEIDRAVELTVRQVEKLREMSPLYEMMNLFHTNKAFNLCSISFLGSGRGGAGAVLRRTMGIELVQSSIEAQASFAIVVQFVHATGMGQLQNRVADIYSTKNLRGKGVLCKGIGIRLPLLPVVPKLFSCTFFTVKKSLFSSIYSIPKMRSRNPVKLSSKFALLKTASVLCLLTIDIPINRFKMGRKSQTWGSLQLTISLYSRTQQFTSTLLIDLSNLGARDTAYEKIYLKAT